MPFQYYPDFFRVIEPHLEAIEQAKKLVPHDVKGRRVAFEEERKLLAGLGRDSDATVTITQHKVPSSCDDISIFEFRPAVASRTECDQHSAAIYHVHGGGIIMGTVMDNEALLRSLSIDTGLPIFSVEYRLAPEYQHPIPVTDVYTGLAWLSAQAASLKIDPTRITLLGESAGGGIAAGAAILARDRQLQPPLAKQVLIRPC